MWLLEPPKKADPLQDGTEARDGPLVDSIRNHPSQWQHLLSNLDARCRLAKAATAPFAPPAPPAPSGDALDGELMPEEAPFKMAKRGAWSMMAREEAEAVMNAREEVKAASRQFRLAEARQKAAVRRHYPPSGMGSSA